MGFCGKSTVEVHLVIEKEVEKVVAVFRKE
jgi:hypothetical protein